MSNTLYTEAELNRLREMLAGIGTHIPTELASEVWSNYKKITKSTEPQPCSCGSSASLWRKAVETIRNFVNEGN